MTVLFTGSTVASAADGVRSMPPPQAGSASPISGLRARLRRETDDLHEALHVASPFRRIAAGTIDRSGYGALLSALARFHATVADAVARGAALLDRAEIAAAAESRRDRLAADLDALGLPLPGPVAAPVLGPAEAVGLTYTVQGSVIGGAVVDRQLEQAGLDGGVRSYWRASGDDRAVFRRLVPALEAYGSDPDRAKGVLSGARTGFLLFAAAIEGL
jgi:heme oxygenase